MRRLGRVVRVALVGVATFAPGVAWAQTTTTTSTSTWTSSTTTSTVAPTTTTTQVNPCADQPCTAEPPGAVLSTATAQVHADRPTFCWRLADGSTLCATPAFAPDYKPPMLVVTEGETVTVQFTPPVPGSPQQVSFSNNGALTPLTATNPTSFGVDLPPGEHEGLSLVTRWLQGDIRYHFRLDVRRSATPAPPSDGRLIALTG